MKANSINTAFVTATIVAYGAGLCLLFTHLYGFDVVFAFLEKYVSPDQHIGPTGRRLLAQAITNSATGLFILGTFSFACTKETFRLQIARLTMADELARWNSKTADPFFIFIWSSLIGITVITLYGLRPMDGFLFKKEGFFETSTAILFAVSSVLLAHTALSARDLRRQLTPNYLLFFYLGIAVIFFLISMEEISWGQTIFRFETPGGYSQVNQQQETNLHNLLSKSYLNTISKIAVVIFSLALLIGWFLLWAKRGISYYLIVPHPSLIILASMILFATFELHLEVVELLLSIFAFFYSFRLFKCRVPKRMAPEKQHDGSSARL